MPGTTKPSITAWTREPSRAQREARSWAGENAVLIEAQERTPDQDAFDLFGPVPPSVVASGSSKVFS